MMRVLALDIALHTGACYDGANGEPMFHTIMLPDLGFGARCQAFVTKLYDLVTVVQPDLIAVEAPLVPIGRGFDVQTTVKTVRLLITLAGLASYVAACAGVAITEKTAQQTKKHLTGSKHADKKAVMDRCRQLGWNPRNYDEADAAALWAMTKAEREPGWSYNTSPLLGRRHG